MGKKSLTGLENIGDTPCLGVTDPVRAIEPGLGRGHAAVLLLQILGVSFMDHLPKAAG